MKNQNCMKTQGLNVVSYFDGMACGLAALKRLGIPVANYFAYETDKYATHIAVKNHPEIKHMGSVVGADLKKLPKIDLVIGGSPCQGFSFAGKMLNFKDPRSALFFEFERAVRELKPRHFLLENVRMKKESSEVITKSMGVGFHELNSSLVSAQNRVRLYWTDLPYAGPPEDKGILLNDVLDGAFSERDKSPCIDANYAKGSTFKRYLEKSRKQQVLTISPEKGCRQIGVADIKGFESMRRVYSRFGKSPALTTAQGGNRQPKVAVDGLYYRSLTPVECERLQTLPDGYTEGVSNTQRYKMLGNGWTVDAVAHFLKPLVQLPAWETSDLM